MPEIESHSLVVYDIEDDKKRKKVSESCLDAGLERIQYSVFWGKLTKTGRKELFRKMDDILGESTGCLMILPVSEDNFSKRLFIDRESKNDALAIPIDNKKNDNKETGTFTKTKRQKTKMTIPGEPIQTIMRFPRD